MQGSFEEATTHFLKAVHLLLQNCFANANIATPSALSSTSTSSTLSLAGGNRNDVEKLLTQYVSRLPVSAEPIVFNIGHCYRRQGKWVKGNYSIYIITQKEKLLLNYDESLMVLLYSVYILI
tara:strand:+ start:128 stop:493 length:366 start_codon:yes stop_codon:yes gene_type:complete